MSGFEKLPADIRNELLDFFSQAHQEQSEFVKESAAKLERWADRFLLGQLTKKDLNRLIESHERLIRQNLNTLEIQARARAEKILFGILNIIRNKLIL